jgi:Protein of unknown function (DUF3435)
MLFSAFTGSRPAALLGDDSSSPNDSQEVSADDLSENTIMDDSDGETLVGSEPGSKARTTRLGTICYGDIQLFLLRNPDNTEQDILMAEVEFRNGRIRARRWASSFPTGSLPPL